MWFKILIKYLSNFVTIKRYKNHLRDHFKPGKGGNLNGFDCTWGVRCLVLDFEEKNQATTTV